MRECLAELGLAVVRGRPWARPLADIIYEYRDDVVAQCASRIPAWELSDSDMIEVAVVVTLGTVASVWMVDTSTEQALLNAGSLDEFLDAASFLSARERASVLHVLGRTTDAERLGEEVRAEYGSCYDEPAATCVDRAQSLVDSGHTREGVDLARYLCEANIASVCFDLGREFIEGGSTTLGGAFYMRACDGGVAEGCAGIGLIMENESRSEEAETYYRRACDGESAWGCSNLSLLLLRAGELVEAQSLAGRGCDLGSGVGCSNAAWAALLAGKAEDAESWAHRALEGNEQDPNPHINLGDSLLVQGRLSDALTEYHRAIELDPAMQASVLDDLDKLEPIYPQARGDIARAREEMRREPSTSAP